jgi:hypothetical protein
MCHVMFVTYLKLFITYYRSAVMFLNLLSTKKKTRFNFQFNIVYNTKVQNAVGRGTELQVTSLIPDGVIGFFINSILPATL